MRHQLEWGRSDFQPIRRSHIMRNFIAALSFAAFAHALAYADESYGPPEPDNTERALPDARQGELRAPREQAEPESAQVERASPEVSRAEETESAAAGEGTQSEGESAGAESDPES